ncbi:hypothetical protein Lepil_0839 [Leptonema illini DSM 21528]|uniref:Uncharacterized protein n=1 Tax=Leptonema illini DSM 21528 TaxID=929563 RepID=H2CEF4_9LEPT|nr:hypothetical protein Lepil_0839 [Leptonema illini DSM 21528]
MREQRFFVHEIHERREKNHRVVCDYWNFAVHLLPLPVHREEGLYGLS